MANLTNSRRDLIEGVVNLLRSEVSGWPTVDGTNFSGVENVWPNQVPDSAEDEFPRGIVDVISGNDFDLSLELDVKLRESVLRIVVFGEESGKVEDLVEKCEDEIHAHSESYVGDWSFRETDGFTPLTENENEEGFLRYNRSIDLVFETVKENS